MNKKLSGFMKFSTNKNRHREPLFVRTIMKSLNEAQQDGKSESQAKYFHRQLTKEQKKFRL